MNNNNNNNNNNNDNSNSDGGGGGGGDYDDGGGGGENLKSQTEKHYEAKIQFFGMQSNAKHTLPSLHAVLYLFQ
jgi:hypothetical protein